MRMNLYALENKRKLFYL